VRELAISPVFDGLRPFGSGAGVTAVERVGLGLATVMVRRGKSAALAQAVRQHYGIALLDAAVCVRHERTSFIGTGHGRWLAAFEARSRTFIEDLQRGLDGSASVVDQSHAFGVLRLSGPAVLSTFEKGVHIDLAADVFKVGSAAATSIAHLNVQLWKVDDAPTFDVAVPRSFAGSFCHWLETSAAIHGLVVPHPGANPTG
jgi:methylglutamate dehydrogenase subunit D